MEKKYKRYHPPPEETVKHVMEHVLGWKKIPTMDRKLVVEGSSPGHYYRDMWRRFGIENMPPATKKEQAKALIDCVKAGAAAIHTHVNADTKESIARGPFHALDADLEGDILDMVFDEVDVVTLNHGWEVVKTPTGEWKTDYVTYHKELIERGKGNKHIQGSVIMTWSGRDRERGVHSAEVVREGVKYMQEHDIKPVWNLHIDHLAWVKQNFIDTGLLKEPYIIQLQLGKHGDERYDIDPWIYYGLLYEMNLVKATFPESKVSIGVHPEGRNWLPLVTMGLLLGCETVRIGIEDMFWMYPHRDDIIKSPAESVRKVVTIAKELGREIATPKEARQMLGIKRAS